jgi:hypothetical protein
LPFRWEEEEGDFVTVFGFNLMVVIETEYTAREYRVMKGILNEMMTKKRTYFACITHQAATRPEMAPLAPREVTVSLRMRIWAVRDTIEPTAPDAR